MKTITGGICAAKGYKAAGIHCGIRKNKSKKDLSLIISEKPASAAAVYTTNLVKGAPLLVTKKHISNGVAQAIICNSGNANTCNSNGIEIAEQTCKPVAEALQMDKADIVVAARHSADKSRNSVACRFPRRQFGCSRRGNYDNRHNEKRNCS